MTPEQALAFVLFSVAAAGPAGPGHAMLTAVGANVGVLRGLPALLGVLVTLDAKEPLTPDAAVTIPAASLRPQARRREAAALRA
jgi:hypothetical protein